MPEPKDWITINGAAVPLDKDGELKGKVGNKIEAESLVVPDTPSKSYTEDLKEQKGDYKKAAHDFFKRELQGKHVMSEMGDLGKQKVYFTGGSWRELKQGISSDPLKAALIPAIPDIVKSGRHSTAAPKHAHQDVSEFHTFSKIIQTAAGEKNVLVDVARRPKRDPENVVYNMTREGTEKYDNRKSFEQKKEPPAKSSGPDPKDAGDWSGNPAVEKNISTAFEVVNIRFEEGEEMQTASDLCFDAATQRHTDENGFLHVAVSHISKETVNPYRGNEIPGWEELGLDPQRIYFGYRKGAELEKAAPTFNGLPLLIGHHHEDAAAPQKAYRIGTLGTEAAYRAPYLDNALVVTDASAIAGIETGARQELSCSYRYDPVFEFGVFEGHEYDFVMTNIRGNHCALVVEGRAGPDVLVADAQLTPNPKGFRMAKGKHFFKRLAGLVLAKDAAPDAQIEQEEVDRAAKLIESAQEIMDLHTETPDGVKDYPGLDAETPDFQRGFAEGVKYGEKKEKAEPGKLFGGPESDGAKKALGACGLDADDPGFQKAFAEGVKYGESEKKHEEGDEKKALGACGLDAESPDMQKAFAEGVKYGEGKEKLEPGKQLAGEHESAKKALDAETVVKAASDAALARFQTVLDAQSEVRPVVGEVRVNLASDTADDVYGAALDALDVNRREHPRSAWRSVFRVVARTRREGTSHTASDSAIAAGSPLSDIKIL